MCSKPSIGFRVTATALELSGTKTFAVKDNIPSHYRFGGSPKEAVVDPIESQAGARALLGKVERRLFDVDMGLKMLE